MTSATWKLLYALAFPGGALLLAAAALLQWVTLPVPASPLLRYYPYAVFGAGILLGSRFNRSRVLFAVLVLTLADRALLMFAPHAGAVRISRIVFDAVAILLPLNLVAFSLMKERGATTPSGRLRFAFIAAQMAVVAFIVRPQQAAAASLLELKIVPPHYVDWARLSQPAIIAFAVAFVVLMVRFLRYRKPIEGGFFWTLVAAFVGLNFRGVGGVSTGYFATAGLILAISVIETSHMMAYQDELTGLAGRRAFNEALLRLGDQYAIGMVDVDHFKKFNDNYGHDQGDQVLRMVASRLSDVSGGGQAFRYGGEEFAVVFPGKSLAEAALHLDKLRQKIEETSFTVRGKDRRTKGGRISLRRQRKKASVTVSMGVAEPSAANSGYDLVIKAADKALYRAKEAGRNRLES